jgi:hypothetical protein
MVKVAGLFRFCLFSPPGAGRVPASTRRPVVAGFEISSDRLCSLNNAATSWTPDES